MDPTVKKILGALAVPGLYMATGPKRAKEMAVDAAKSAYSGVTLPHDVYTGKASPNDTKRVMDLTGLVGTGGLTHAMTPEAEGTLGIFGGRRSRAYQEDSDFAAAMDDAAQRLQQKGTDHGRVWTNEGIGIEPHTGKPYYEIDDSRSSVRGPLMWSDPANRQRDLVNSVPQRGYYTASELFDHPQLYGDYPFLADVPVWLNDQMPLDAMKGNTGMAWRGPLSPKYGGKPGGPDVHQLWVDYNQSPEEMRKIFLHELQHNIQEYEGFDMARGQELPRDHPNWGENYYKRPHEGGPIGSFNVEFRSDSSFKNLHPAQTSHYNWPEVHKTPQPKLTSAPTKGRFSGATFGKRNAPIPELPENRAKGLTLYTGSPARFDKFDLGMLGTGSGVNAEGRGFYLSDNPLAAEKYRELFNLPDAFANSKGVVKDRGLVDELSLVPSGTDYDGMRLQSRNAFSQNVDETSPEWMRRVADEHSAGDKFAALWEDPSVYKVQVDLDPSRILPIDGVKLGSLPKKQRDVFFDVAKKRQLSETSPMPTDDDYVRRWASKIGDDADRAALKDAGVDAFQYEGWEDAVTDKVPKNYVVFNPDQLRITDRIAKTFGVNSAVPNQLPGESFEEYITRLMSTRRAIEP